MKSILQKLAQLKLNAVPEPWVHFVHTGDSDCCCRSRDLLGMNKWLAGAIMLLVAGVIESWFDKHYELETSRITTATSRITR